MQLMDIKFDRFIYGKPIMQIAQKHRVTYITIANIVNNRSYLL